MLCDAHNHLHDARLDPWRGELLRLLPSLGITGAVVNGTRAADWPAVSRLCRENSWLRPAFGLHPWYLTERPADWECQLTALLDQHPEASVGEIGLDGWVENHDLNDQIPVFVRQVEIARDRRLPVTVHCVRAWEPLRQLLRSLTMPDCWLLHAWGGPAELLPLFVDKGARFSFPPYFIHPGKSKQREMFAQIPEDRLLLETDAPAMSPPAGSCPWVLDEGVNHPASLLTACESLAAVRGWSVEKTAQVTTRNFLALFGDPVPENG